MDRIQIKASELWDLLFADETAQTYEKTLNLTGTILTEFAQLIWLIICSVFVFGAWFSDTSVRTGKGIRNWVDNSSSDVSVPTDSEAIADKGKNLLDTGRTGVAYLLNQAREQLGIDPEEMPAIARATKVIKPDPKPAATSAPTASAPSPNPTPASPASAAPAAQSAPTVKPFAKPAANSPGPANNPTVGGSRGAGTPSPSSPPVEETVQEDDDNWPPKDSE